MLSEFVGFWNYCQGHGNIGWRAAVLYPQPGLCNWTRIPGKDELVQVCETCSILCALWRCCEGVDYTVTSHCGQMVPLNHAHIRLTAIGQRRR
jgi:hypothetical protein